MKRIFLSIVFSLFLGNLLFAQEYNGAKVIIVMVDKTKEERLELKTLVSEKINENLTKYAGLKFLNVDSDFSIRQFIRNAESSGEYDEKTLTEVGKKHFADYVIFSEIIKDGSGYNLSCNFTNLATGLRVPILITGIKSPDALYEGTGCAVDELTINFCNQTGIFLENEQISFLRNGDTKLNDEELRKKYEDDIAESQRKIQELDEQIEALKLSTNLLKAQEIKGLEMKRAMEDAKLQGLQQKEQRRQEAERKKREDKKRDAERTAEQKKNRDEMERRSDEKIENLRKTKLEGASMFSQINIIEAKKKVLTEIYEYTETDVAESNSFLQGEMAEKISEIKNKEYSPTEKRNGVPTDAAKQYRQNQIEGIETEYQKRMAEEEENIRKSTKPQQNKLYKEIYSDYKVISKNRTISSVGSDLKYSIGEYDGLNDGWNITLYIYSDDIPLAQQNFVLKYKDLTGKMPVTDYKAKGYKEWLDTVDLYDSSFRRGKPILIFEVDYNAKAKPDDFPSQYYFNFISIRVIRTETEKVLSTQKPSQTSIEYKMPIAYDIRSFETKKKIEKRERIAAAQEQQRQEAEYQRQEAERKRKEEEAEQKRQQEEAKRQKEENKKRNSSTKLTGIWWLWIAEIIGPALLLLLLLIF